MRILLLALLFLAIQISSAATIDTLQIYSAAMKKNLAAIVAVPEKSGDHHRQSVVYLLHGYSGNYTDWSKHVELNLLADKYKIILVCPEGGYNSWYLDSPLQQDSQYESHIINEVIPAIDKRYFTIAKKEGRAITGLSMGGYGALYLAIRHPQLFKAVGSMSGVVDLQFSTKRWEIAQKIGTYDDYPQRWEKHSVINMVKQMEQAYLAFIIDCGVDDIFIDINRKLHQKMLQLNIPHTYTERPGGHSWDYWTNAIQYHLLFFKKSFQSK